MLFQEDVQNRLMLFLEQFLAMSAGQLEGPGKEVAVAIWRAKRLQGGEPI